MRVAARRQSPEAGFTLLEILVAITVLALLMVGLSQGVRTGFGFWSAQARRGDEVAQLDSTARLLRSLLTGIPIRPAGGGAAQVSISFEARADELAFVSDLPTGLGASRRANITIFLRGDRLVLTWTPHRQEQSAAQSPASEVELIRGIDGLEFAFWGAAAGGAPAWLAEWKSPALPELIRIRIRFAKGDRRRWPDLVAAPQLWAP